MSRRLPRPERRAQLIEAAAAAFLARGFDGTSMDDVAQEAGVTRLIVYRIFENKHDVYRAVLGTVLDELARVFDGVDVEAVRVRGAANLPLPVARAHPDASDCCGGTPGTSPTSPTRRSASGRT